jgi:integrative and conjugative element protein (TIGR02256 family)
MRSVRVEGRAERRVTFWDDTALLAIEIREPAIKKLLRHRQHNARTSERGGQLFGATTPDRFVVLEATGARRGDAATPTSYVIDRKAAQSEIDARYPHGLHFVGDWHTHPVESPSPSSRDVRSMRNLYRTSRHGMGALMMLIVGTSDNASDWHCSLHNGELWVRLTTNSGESQE